jgi:hypothetical protein
MTNSDVSRSGRAGWPRPAAALMVECTTGIPNVLAAVT